MAATETPITELTPVYTDPAVLQGKAVLVHDPTTGAGIVFDASKLDPSEKYQKPNAGIPKTDMTESVQTSLDKADASAPQSTTYTKTDVDNALETKADKDTDAVEGNLAEFDANGNPVDSGISSEKFSEIEGEVSELPVEKGTGVNSVQQKGTGAVASGEGSVAEGVESTASSNSSHAEGLRTFASAQCSHAEGTRTKATYAAAHAEGADTIASGNRSHAEGDNTLAQNYAEHAQGRFNKSNKAGNSFGDAGNTIHSVGIGAGENDRKNAIEVMQNGNVYIKGFGGYNGTNPSSATPINTILTGANKMVVLTQAQYDALSTKDANTLYFIK